MRQRIVSLQSALLVGLGAALLWASTGYAQLIVTEREIERQARTQWLMMKRQMPQSPSPRIQAYVECVAHRIIDVLDPSFDDLSWEVIVFDDDSVNAFAMPGGKVGVFTGILNVADTPDALAAVLGHEVAHLTSNHVMERARRQSGSNVLGMIGGAATGMRGMSQAAADIFVSLPFSRRQEGEADIVGLEYMAKAGFDPRATIALWKNMSEARNARQAEFLSTHPSDDRRLDDLVKSLTPALIQYNAAREAGNIPNCAL